MGARRVSGCLDERGGWKNKRMHGMTTKRESRRGENYAAWAGGEEGAQRGWPRDMNALLTFWWRHVDWQRGGSAEEDDKYKAVKWK